MEKGIVVEHRKRYTIVMNKKGMFRKAPVMKEAIGEEVIYKPKPVLQTPFFFFSMHRKWAAMLVVCLLICIPGYFMLTEKDAYAVVSIDMNPSINLTINRDFEVMAIEAMNEDAKEIVNKNDLQGQPITDITNQIIQLARSDPDPNGKKAVLVAISYLKEEADLAAFEDELASYFDHTDYALTIYEVPRDLFTKAQTEHISMNEVLAETLYESGYTDPAALSAAEEEDYPSLDEKEKELIRYYYNDNQTSNEEKDAEDKEKRKNTFIKESVKEPKKTPEDSGEISSEKNKHTNEGNSDKVKSPEDKEKDFKQKKKTPNMQASETGKENAKNAQEKGNKGKNKAKKKEKNKEKSKSHKESYKDKNNHQNKNKRNNGIKNNESNKRTEKHSQVKKDNASKTGRENRNKGNSHPLGK